MSVNKVAGFIVNAMDVILHLRAIQKKNLIKDSFAIKQSKHNSKIRLQKSLSIEVYRESAVFSIPP